jgi:rod shape-determining protein MreD
MNRRPGIQPRPTLGRQLDMAARHALPAASTALLLLALGAPLGLPGQAELQDCTALGCVFFWSVYRPAAMPPIAVFAIGLLADLLGFGPLGANAMVLLACHAVALRWRRELARLGLVAVWLAFVMVGAAGAALGWLLQCVLALQWYPPWPGVLQAGLGCGVFPLLALLLTRAHRTLAEPNLA